MMDHTRWPTGKEFTVVEVAPMPAGREGYGLYQVLLRPRDEDAEPDRLWCRTQHADRPLQPNDVVAVRRGRTFIHVLVDRLTQEVPDGSRYLLRIPLP
jgi:hypothetical protein